MKLTIVSDSQGKILSISQFGDVGDKVSGITKAGVALEPGQSLHEIDVPGEFQKLSLLDLHQRFKVDLAKDPAKLVKS